MKYWINKVVLRFGEDFGYKSFCEIGASLGGATDKLLAADGIRLTVIDPCLDADLCAKYGSDQRITLCRGLSLEEIPKLPGPFDCILIDGDHNWFTVFNELKAIEERGLLNNGGTIFFHDVGWPYGRRDLYYQPETIPAAFRHPYARKGIVHGKSELSPDGGQNAAFCNAEMEGGEKNGVLTAVEDFLKTAREEYWLFRFNDECGLGVLVKMNGVKSRWALAKWRCICALWNVFGTFKNAVKHGSPGLYETVRHGFKKTEPRQNTQS